MRASTGLASGVISNHPLPPPLPQGEGSDETPLRGKATD